jgi:Ca-activated chloride channel family protein
MLNLSLTPHREFLPADTPEQKLFVMLKVKPDQEVAASQPPTTFVFVIDTSGSMFEIICGEPQSTGRNFHVDGQDYTEVNGEGCRTKIDVVIDSLKALLYSGKLRESDRLAIIQFNDSASTLIGLTPGTETQALEMAVDNLRNFSGGTRLALGMQQALNLLAGQQMTSRRVLIFTDGHTFDDEQCRQLAPQFASYNIPITALGVGEYAEDLLINLSDATAGRLFPVVPDATDGLGVSIEALPEQIIDEYARAQEDVITNINLTVKTVKDVQLSRLVRAYPEQAELSLKNDPYLLGNATAYDQTIFILEFTLNSRPAARTRLAQLGLTYDIPGKNRRGEVQPQNVIVEFVSGQMGAQVNQEVMGYLQQCNLAQMVRQATQVAESNPEQADKLLENALRMTQKIGNERMTRSLADIQSELRKTRKISPESRKTVKMGAKGKTVKLSEEDLQQGLSDEQIRKITGT